MKLMETEALSAGKYIYVTNYTFLPAHATRLGNQIMNSETLNNVHAQFYLTKFIDCRCALFANAYGY